MADVHSKVIRSKNMRAIRGQGTAIEKRIGGLLTRLGVDWRSQDRQLPGRPDFVVPQYGCVIFTHGCFWHRHRCYLFKPPGTRTAFWLSKIESNVQRDRRNITDLQRSGWRVLVVWECALRGKQKCGDDFLLERIEEWLCEGGALAQIDSDGIHTGATTNPT